MAQKVPESLGSQISLHSTHEGGEVVSLTHRPPLPAGNVRGTHFLLGAESTPGPWCSQNEHVTEKSSDTTAYRSRDSPTSSAAP